MLALCDLSLTASEESDLEDARSVMPKLGRKLGTESEGTELSRQRLVGEDFCVLNVRATAIIELWETRVRVSQVTRKKIQVDVLPAT